MTAPVIVGTTFAASAVECVEAATVFLAVGFANGWRAATIPAIWAIVVLGACIALGAPFFSEHVLAYVRLAVGPFLMIFGMAWQRKAIWRFAGRKALHDETAIFAQQTLALTQRNDARYGSTLVFQTVCIEGLEVAAIVVSFSAAQPSLFGWAVAGAAAALCAVCIAAFFLRAPLARVPENALKAAVGVMLVSLGAFWTGEALGFHWWMDDLSLVALIAGDIALMLLAIAFWRARAT